MEQCSIKEEVSVRVKDGAIMIEPIMKHPRERWEQQFIDAGSLDDKENMMGDFGNKFDEEEWQW